MKERRRSTIVARRDAACRQARALVTVCSTRTGSTGTMAAPPPTVDLQHCVCWRRLAACMLAYLSVHKLPLHARSASLLFMRTAESSSARLERDGNFRASTPLRLPMLPALAPHPYITPLTVQSCCPIYCSPHSLSHCALVFAQHCGAGGLLARQLPVFIRHVSNLNQASLLFLRSRIYCSYIVIT